MKDTNEIRIKENDRVSGHITELKSFGRTGHYHFTGIVVRHNGRLKVKVDGENNKYIRLDHIIDRFSEESQITIIQTY